MTVAIGDVTENVACYTLRYNFSFLRHFDTISDLFVQAVVLVFSETITFYFCFSRHCRLS